MGVRPAHLRAALRAAALTVSDSGPVTREDVYHDNQGGSMFRAGLRLSREVASGAWRLCDVSGALLGEAGGGAARPAGALRTPVEEATAGGVLVPYLRVRSRASTLVGRGAGRVVVHLELGRAECVDPFGPSVAPALRRLTVSAGTASARAAATLVAVLRASLALGEENLDVLSRGLDMLGLAPPGAPVPDSLRVAEKDSIAAAARKVLRRQAYKMQANLEGTVRDLDPEYLHDLRVSTRRARAATRVFAGVLRPASRATRRRELAWIAALLGEVRDLDVFLDRLRSQFERADVPAGVRSGLTAVVQRRRESAREPLVDALRSRRFARLVADLAAGRGVNDRGDGAGAAPEVGGTLIRKGVRRVRREAGAHPESLDDARLHRLRIAFKRLRYTCEFLAELYGEAAAEAIGAMVRVQDTLGRHQDAIVAGAMLAELEGELAASDLDPVELGRSIGCLLQVQREEKLAARGTLAVEIAKAEKALSRLRHGVATR